MADKDIICRDCGTTFTFTESEQEFYAQKGFTNEPTRCSACRRIRKQQREGGSGGGYESRGGGGGRSEARQMYPAVCAACGADTQVPFQPRGDRPVYCSSCYENERGRSESSSRYGSGGGGGGGRRW